MTEKDHDLLHMLMKKAADAHMYDIAVHLRDARNNLRVSLNKQWTEEILKDINDE